MLLAAVHTSCATSPTVYRHRSVKRLVIPSTVSSFSLAPSPRTLNEPPGLFFEQYIQLLAERASLLAIREQDARRAADHADALRNGANSGQIHLGGIELHEDTALLIVSRTNCANLSFASYLLHLLNDIHAQHAPMRHHQTLMGLLDLRLADRLDDRLDVCQTELFLETCEAGLLFADPLNQRQACSLGLLLLNFLRLQHLLAQTAHIFDVENLLLVVNRLLLETGLRLLGQKPLSLEQLRLKLSNGVFRSINCCIASSSSFRANLSPSSLVRQTSPSWILTAPSTKY